MAVDVLLGNAEVDVKEEVTPRRCRFRMAAAEQLPEPVVVDELLVVGQSLEREAFVCGPLGPAGVGANRCLDSPCDPVTEERCPFGVAVDHELGAFGDPFVDEELLKLALVEPRQPGGGKRDRTRDVAASGSTRLAPTVVVEQRSYVDDAEAGLPDSASQLACGDLRFGHRRLDFDGGHLSPSSDSLLSKATI